MLREERACGLKNREIFKKTLCFVWPRVPFGIVGGFVLVCFPYIAVRLTEKMEGFFPSFLIAAMSAAGILLAKNIISYGKKRDTMAQIAMTARGVVYGVLPANVKQEGYRVSKYHFEHITVGDISKRAFRTVYDDFIKKNGEPRPGENRGLALLAELKTFAEMFIINTLPYVGECVLAWEFAYPGTTFEESICDSAEVLKNNWLRMTLLILLEIIRMIIKVILVILVSGTLFVLFVGLLYSLKNSVDILTGLTDFFSNPDIFDETAVLMLPEYLSAVAVFPFFRSSSRIRVFRAFFKAADRKPPTGRIYAELGNAVRRLKSEESEAELRDE